MSAGRVQHVSPACRLVWGDDALAALPQELDRAGSRRVVVFCGASMARHDDTMRRLATVLGDRLVGVFDGVREHSPIPAVEAGRDVLAELDADGVVALGGGSAVVTARAATILLAEDRDLRELCTRREADGRLVSPRLDAPKLAQWVVPSTPTTAYAKAGSAVRDPATGDRLALYDPKTRARGLFLDAAVACTAPADLALGSALNALAMAVDGLQATSTDPIAEGEQLQAVRLLRRWLPRLGEAPDDADVRLQLLLAAYLSGRGSDHTGTGLAQALSHAAGPRSSHANGVVEAILVPHALRFNAEVVAARLPLLADALGIPGGQQAPAGTEQVAEAFTALLVAAGVPQRLREVGLDPDDFDEIVDHTLDDWMLTRIPRPAGRDDLLTLLHRAW